MPKLFLKSRLYFLLCVLVTACLAWVIQDIAPQQLPVIIYKIVLVIGGGLAGYFLDRSLFRYAEPCSYLDTDWRNAPDADNKNGADYPVVMGYKLLFAVAQARQALLIVACMLATGLGL